MKGAALRSLSPRGARKEREEREEREARDDPRLGPAVVTAVLGDAVTVALAGGEEVRAVLALALPYAACPGDVLLVIGQGGEHYAIGVVSGRGKTSLAIQGDVSLRAVGGALELSGDEGVRIRGPAVDVHTDALRTVARSVVETFTTLFQRVTEAVRVHAGETVTLVDGGAYTQAKTAAIQTEETVTINGKEIHLG
jgi:hypothetical protein